MRESNKSTYHLLSLLAELVALSVRIVLNVCVYVVSQIINKYDTSYPLLILKSKYEPTDRLV